MRKLTLLLLLFVGIGSNAQKFQFLGVDTTMNHTRGNVHFLTTLEHYSSEDNDKPISITQINTEVSYYLLHRLSVGGNLHFSIPRGSRYINFIEHNANTFGAGFAGSLRWEAINFSHHNFYLETSYGVLYTLEEFPPGGTNWNFSSRYGLGYNIHLSKNRYLFFGWRWMHISNGTGLVPGNPAYDGNGLYLGFKFSK